MTVACGGQSQAEPTPIQYRTPLHVSGLATDGTVIPAVIETPDTREEVTRAEDYYGLQRGLLNAIAVLESSGGVNACGFNDWGYASCAVTFASRSEGIWTVAATLASYGGDTAWKLCVWNAGPTGCREGRADLYVAQGLALLSSPP